MSITRGERRLAAILAADIAGYSRLMGADEEGTLGRLQRIRADLINPQLVEYRGRVVKTTGDGLLVEFASAVEAARCAAAIQRLVAELNAERPQEQRLEFRIGIHVGDIISDDGDIFGDGVNIAARLEGIAEPTSIFVSDDAYRQIRGKADMVWQDLGPQSLKNIAEPMRTWRMASADGTATSPVISSPNLSIAVLPFKYVGDDPNQGYFAEGLTATLTTNLSRISGALVIASSTTATLKSELINTKQVGRELGVRYLLSGSVQKVNRKIRIIAQLSETVNARQLWADRFDGDECDFFDLQDQVTTRIASSVGRKIVVTAVNEAESRSVNATAIDHLMRGLILANSPQTLENLAEQEQHFRKALEADRENVEVMARLGRALCLQAWQFAPLLQSEDVDLKLDEGLKLSEEALHLDADHAFAHIPKGLYHIAKGNFPEAFRVFENAHILDRNLGLVLQNLATICVRLGRPLDTIRYAEKAIFLDPRGPQIALAHTDIGVAHFFLGNDSAALSAFSKARTLNARLPRIYPALASLLAKMGDSAGAGTVVGELLRIAPAYRLANSIDFPTKHSPLEYKKAFEELFLPWARLAGLP